MPSEAKSPLGGAPGAEAEAEGGRSEAMAMGAEAEEEQVRGMGRSIASAALQLAARPPEAAAPRESAPRVGREEEENSS